MEGGEGPDLKRLHNATGLRPLKEYDFTPQIIHIPPQIRLTLPMNRTFTRHAMPVAQLTLEIRIDHAQSLKDRRHVVRSLKDQLRQSFNVSVAEMDEATLWNSATLGIVAVSRSRDYLHGLMDELERAARRMAAELSAELADAFWDYIES